MTRPARVCIDLSALEHNLNLTSQSAPRSRVMAIIKADGYGHGIIRIARALKGADAFGVACLEEASVLHNAGIDKPILLLEGPYQQTELETIARLGLHMVVHDESQVRMLEQTDPSAPIQVWMKVDSGMHRLGFSPESFSTCYQRLKQCPAVADNLRLMTHLATANEPGSEVISQQLECFSRLTADIQVERSIANSAAVLSVPESHQDWIRPGLMLYGISPFTGQTAADHGLRPVMTLESSLISVKPLKAGEPVGYGATWRCPEDMPVGIVAAGYGDGYPRHAPSGTPVLVNGVRVGLAGRASMDMLAVDLRNCPDARIGDTVTLWGNGLPVEEVAEKAGTIPYELVCAVHKRLRFVEHGQG